MTSNKKQKGYTLIELLVVVAIIGILGAIAIPGYIGYRLKAERSVAWTDLQTLRLLEEQFFAESSAYIEGVDTATLMVNLPGFQPDPGSLYAYSVSFVGGDNQTFMASAARAADPFAPFTIDNTNSRETAICASGSCW